MTQNASGSRRSMLAALGAGGLGLALAQNAAGARSLQMAERPSLAGHPIVGAWLVQLALPTALDVTIMVTTLALPDGMVITSYPVTEMTGRGVVYKAPAVGVWEPVDDRRAHMTKLLVLASAEGAFMGTVTFDVYYEVSEDGRTFTGQHPDNLVTVRDASNAIFAEIPGGPPQPPITGHRISPDHVPFPEPDAGATPAG